MNRVSVSSRRMAQLPSGMPTSTLGTIIERRSTLSATNRAEVEIDDRGQARLRDADHGEAGAKLVFDEALVVEQDGERRARDRGDGVEHPNPSPTGGPNSRSDRIGQRRPAARTRIRGRMTV
jgi:hypothetical protein